MERESRRRRSTQVAPVGGNVDPSDVQLTPGQNLLYKRIIPFSNPVLSLVAGYDNIFKSRIERVLASHTLFGDVDPIGRYSVYSLRLTRIVPPDADVVLQGKKTPKVDVYARLEREWRNKDGTPVVENGEVVRDVIQDEVISHIPVMRGSEMDPVKSRRERYERGDDPLLPDGYFNIDGSKKYIVLYNGLKYDIPITFAKKDEVITSVICTTPDMSTVQIIVANNEKNELLCRTTLLGMVSDDKGKGKAKPKMHFVTLYDYMVVLMNRKEVVNGVEVIIEPTPRSITELILTFVLEEHRDACRTILLLSEVTRHRKDILTGIKADTRLDDDIDTIERRMIEEIYPVIPSSERELKSKQLAYVASRHLLYLARIHKPDDRDAPGLFRMQTPEIVITKLFADKLRASIDAIKVKGGGAAGISDILDTRTVDRNILEKKSIRTLYRSLASLNIMNQLAKARDDVIGGFKKGNFGGKNIKKPQQTFKPGTSQVVQKGIVARLDTGSYSQAWSNLTKRGVPTSNKGKSIKVRSGHPGRVGYEDLMKSPDDNMIGLITFLAATEWTSIDRSGSPVIAAIASLFPEGLPSSEVPGMRDLIFVNGIIQGYANGPQLVRSLNKLREGKGPLREYFDSMFFYNISRREVIILTDAGRLTRPLLVVDGDQLVIDKKGLRWDSPLSELLAEGAIRYVDAYQGENGDQAAQFPGYFRIRWEEVNTAEKVRNDIAAEIERAKKGVGIKGVNIELLLDTLRAFRVAYKRGVTPVVEARIVLVEEASRQLKLLDDYILRARSLIHYDYCEVDADVILGFSSAIVPYLNRTSGTKQAYSAHMSTQAVGQSSPNYVLNNSPVLRLLNNGQRGMTETGMASILGTATLPATNNVVLAILSGTTFGDYGGGGQEDAIQVKKSAVERGLLNYTMHKRITFTSPATSSVALRSSRPTGTDYTEIYANIDVRGVVLAGTEVNEGDVVISFEKQEANGRWKRKNILARPGESGIVTDVYFIQDPLYIQVCLSQVRQPTVGSKLSSMSANKGVIVEVTEDDAMPYDEVTGMRPDVILSPVGIPTRGTVGLLTEMISGSASALLGQRGNASGMSQEFKMEQVGKILTKAGFDSKGEINLIDSRSGERYRGTVSTGIIQMQLINMTIEETFNPVGVVHRHPWNAQPVKGKKKGGGVRMGVAEGDGLAYHGMEEMRRSVYYRSSDGIKVPVCVRCGRFATASQKVGQYECTPCLATLPTSESYKARDIAQVEVAGSWRHIQQTLLMRGIEATHILRPHNKRTE